MKPQEKIWNKVLSVALIAAILGAIIALGYSIVSPIGDDEFTDFYILGPRGEAADYPTELTIGEEGKLIGGIVNHEGKDASYRLEIVVSGLKLDEIGPLHLSDDETWEDEIIFSPQVAGEDQKVEFQLYKDGETEPYLEPLHVWINITETDGTLLPSTPYHDGIIIDHNVITALATSGHIDLGKIPEYWIKKAKSDIHIAYEHTSHGTQLVSGMEPLDEFMGGEGLYVFSMDQKYEFEEGGFFWDEAMEGYGTGTLVLSDDGTWYPATVAFLEDPDNYDVDVVMWSWCGGVTEADEEGINIYLDAMNQLELDYPDIKFIYMTGHADGTGLTGNLHIRNQQIRDYCEVNNKILYDFYDIECYDPDGNYFGDKGVRASCDYKGGNWAIEYQNSHIEGVDWYDCESAHSQPVDANQKAYAVWYMLARLAGWDGEIIE